jgi:putative flippase GtrA
VGGISFILDFSIYFALVHFFSVNYLISAATAFIISVMVNYLMSTEWVFNQSKIQNKALEFNLFMIISIVGLVFTEILLYLFTDIGGTNYLISKIIVAIIVLFWNFTARRIMFYGKKT